MEEQKKHWAKAADLGALASVIDPNDARGFKNRYIAAIRDTTVLGALPPGDLQILDFGCGTGNLSMAIASPERRITGVDISPELLEIAKNQNDPAYSEFHCYDGRDLPFASGSFDFATTYVVLNHITDDEALSSVLRELHRVLDSAATLLCIEQTRATTKLVYNGIKKQRSTDDFLRLFENAGFTPINVEAIRKARFLGTYLVRYGLVGARFFRRLARIDRFFAKTFPNPVFSYVDTMFVLRKSGRHV